MNRRVLSPIVCFLLIAGMYAATPVFADDGRVLSANSPTHRVALLELYTSEGCSSCLPADRWLSRLKDSGTDPEQLIPLAFHVTYWDYIGWKDRFASPDYDRRQRRQAALANSRSVYTPQFMLNGRDYRGYRNLVDDIRAINDEPATLDLGITINSDHPDSLDVRVDASGDTHRNIAIYIALYENGLSSDVSDGENEGEHMHHDFVVRRFIAPTLEMSATNKTTVFQQIPIENGWRRKYMGVVAFAQDVDAGEVLQVVRIGLDENTLALHNSP